MNLNFDCNLELFSHEQDFFEAFQYISFQKENPDFKLFNSNQQHYEEEIEKLQSTADKIKQRFTTLIIIGMGGAILNPKSLAPFNKNNHLEVIFFDTIDPQFFHHVRQKSDLNKVGFLVISKSGETLETISLCLSWIEVFKQNHIKNIHDHFFFITGIKNNTLRNIALDIKAEILPHAGIGGRFASFTNINLLPLQVMNLNAADFCLGGIEILQDFLNNESDSLVAKSTSFLLEVARNNHSIHVTMSYLKILWPYLEWNNQIIAESLGKNGFGITPIDAYGPKDQHSQLQLYLDGPKDKFFTLLHSYKPSKIELPKLTFQGIAGKDISELINAQYSALYETLNENELPVRKILLKDHSIKSLGALMMHSMLETIVFALIRAINPFDQPAVEDMKRLVYKLLQVA